MAKDNPGVRESADARDQLRPTERHLMIVSGWGAATNRGKVRPVNEDALLADPPLFVVADGMGGHAAGDVASRLGDRPVRRPRGSR